MPIPSQIVIYICCNKNNVTFSIWLVQLDDYRNNISVAVYLISRNLKIYSKLFIIVRNMLSRYFSEKGETFNCKNTLVYIVIIMWW